MLTSQPLPWLSPGPPRGPRAAVSVRGAESQAEEPGTTGQRAVVKTCWAPAQGRTGLFQAQSPGQSPALPEC